MSQERNIKLAQDLASVLVFEQSGAPVETPQAGDYTISMKPGMRFAGHQEKAIAVLQSAFPGCNFAWKPEPPPEPRKKRK